MNVRYNDFPMDVLDTDVFQREALRPNEEIIACLDISIRGNWSSGLLLTDQALIKWSKKKCERFEFDSMQDIVASDESSRGTFKFKYDEKSKFLTIAKSGNFFRTVLDTVPKHKQSSSTTLWRKIYEYQSFEKQHKPAEFFAIKMVKLNEDKLRQISTHLSSEQSSMLENANKVKGDKGNIFVYPTHLSISYTGQSPIAKDLGKGLGMLFYGLPINMSRPTTHLAWYKWDEIHWIKYISNFQELLICGETEINKKNLYVFEAPNDYYKKLLEQIAKYFHIDGVSSSTH